MRTSSRRPTRGLRWLPVAALCAVLASCSSAPPPAPAPAPPAPATTAPTLDGWKLTLPLASKKGDAATVDPAQATPPYLTLDPTGSVTFWAPVNGATTKHSEHARTELDNLSNFTAGSDQQTLAATVSVAQLPTTDQDVIIGQIHGADDISSVPFVMLHYAAGLVSVVVKQQQSGDALTTTNLLTDVPLDARFDYGIRDDGNGMLTLLANYNDQHTSQDVPIPDAFRGATVRFQAGAYQLADSTLGPAADTDGARVTFYSLTAGPAAPTG